MRPILVRPPIPAQEKRNSISLGYRALLPLIDARDSGTSKSERRAERLTAASDAIDVKGQLEMPTRYAIKREEG